MSTDTDSHSTKPRFRIPTATPFRLGFVAFALFFAVSQLTRIALLTVSAGNVEIDAPLGIALLTGTAFDAVAGLFAALPWVLLGAVLPKRIANRRAGRWLLALAVAAYSGVLVLIAIAEWFFWDEFGSRFNFIAVDYLVFTREVLGNIAQSYPLGLIAAGIVAGMAASAWAVARLGVARWATASGASAAQRIIWPAIVSTACACAVWGVNQSSSPAFTNQYTAELAKNGCWSFCAALRGMELDYQRWYVTLPEREAMATTRQMLEQSAARLESQSLGDLRRHVTSSGPERRWNVMFVCMESMSLGFTGAGGNPESLTPNLDRIARGSVNFAKLHATGTRTVRGMEAITLGLPPTPGQSIIYRPEGTGLWTYFAPFIDRGYDCAFFYGGDGRFDFMNRYFSSSGCRIMDANAWERSDTTFKTAWGACDEDLFRKAIREADADHAAGRPFHYFCMTTSNHRPYDFPQGRIDLQPHSGRLAAVKYADWAVGRLLDEARSKPWYSETLFVFCSDHCASSAGKADLDVTKYRIPAMIYNPGLVAAKEIAGLTSQIDVMPTVLGLLGWDYETRGFGADVLAGPAPGRAFVSNYQKIALLREGRIAILKPNRIAGAYCYDAETGGLGPLSSAASAELRHDATAFYQSAAWWFHSGRMKRGAEFPPPTPVASRFADPSRPASLTNTYPPTP
jgi:phosphoglycerol transferase MdoB-like AlkP superfamily enzyme